MRGGYGALQLAAPGMVARALLNRRLDTRARTLSRVLGARQLAQALASGGSPSCPVLALGVEVDLLHGGSMVALGIAESAPERGAARCADWRLVRTLAATRVSSAGQQRAPVGSALVSLRASWAERLAGLLVPGYATRSTQPGLHHHLSGSMQRHPSAHRFEREPKR